jgi:uncharacterized protein YjbJ (UPF0337 family)
LAFAANGHSPLRWSTFKGHQDLGLHRNSELAPQWQELSASRPAQHGIKEGAGKISGDKELEQEGKTDKAKGDLHEAAGNVKDAARKAADSLKK